MKSAILKPNIYCSELPFARKQEQCLRGLEDFFWQEHIPSLDQDYEWLYQYWKKFQIIFLNHLPTLRYAVVKWLEQLVYGAESRRKFEAELCKAQTGKLSVNPAVNRYLFRIRER